MFKSVPKIDSLSLVTGKPVYTEDLEPEDALVIKLYRGEYAYAKILSVDKEKAMKVDGIVAIYTYDDVPKTRFTAAGQSYPEPSPYDRLILDQYVRYMGDPVCIVVGENEKAVDTAIKRIKVEYEVYEPVLDIDKACDNETIIHDYPEYHVNYDIGNEVKRNICASGSESHGDLEKAFAESDIVLEKTYHTQATNQSMMEPFKTACYFDIHQRLNILSSTQVPFHVRRIVSMALGLPMSKVKVIKPRIGGGFGAKQTLVTDVIAAFVTFKTGRPSRLYFTRKECYANGSGRHEMKITVKIGATKNGEIKGISMFTLSNTGAYGEHGPTTVGLTASKSISLYNKIKAHRFDYRVVYTNKISAGAFRGYGATQGTYALESIVNELAIKLDMDPTELRIKNLGEVGEIMPSYYNEELMSTALRACIERGKKMIDWDKKYPNYTTKDGKEHAMGMAITMQGSGISNIDIASVSLKLNDDGCYTFMIGATDLGTGCDTILTQMAAKKLNCDMSDIIFYGVDTDISPYDTGSYASSTTYVTGNATVRACDKMINAIKENAARLWNAKAEDIEFDGKKIKYENKTMSLKDFAFKMTVGDNSCIMVNAEFSSPISPPPFMAGFAEIEVDKDTGLVKVVDYVGVVDCGTVINPGLARVQTESGIVQGIGMALFEDTTFGDDGKLFNDSLMQYKIPSRMDIGRVRVEFESSYEPTGPFGAKSIGEVVINTPSPAIAAAIYNATGRNLRKLPMKPEDIIL